MSVWIQKEHGFIILAWRKGRAGWNFETEYNQTRFTILSPNEWGWEYLSEL